MSAAITAASLPTRLRSVRHDDEPETVPVDPVATRLRILARARDLKAEAEKFPRTRRSGST